MLRLMQSLKSDQFYLQMEYVFGHVWSLPAGSGQMLNHVHSPRPDLEGNPWQESTATLHNVWSSDNRRGHDPLFYGSDIVWQLCLQKTSQQATPKRRGDVRAPALWRQEAHPLLLLALCRRPAPNAPNAPNAPPASVLQAFPALQPLLSEAEKARWGGGQIFLRDPPGDLGAK